MVRGIEVMGKETQSFPVFGMQKERKYFPGGRENMGEIGSFPTPRPRVVHGKERKGNQFLSLSIGRGN